MQEIKQIIASLKGGEYEEMFRYLYAGKAGEQQSRYVKAAEGFIALYGEREAELFSAPGRTEVGGNHTDHQHGRVLAAAVNLDIICVAAKNSDGIIRIKSEGYPMDEIDLSDLAAKASEVNQAAAVIRGIAFRCRELGYEVSGFDAYTTSDVLKGSGLSSSAAFEVAIGTMISHLYNDGAISAVEIAQIGQFAENVYYGKPSGLMDQTASSVGGFITIDFADTAHPLIEPVSFDFASCRHTLCIVDTKGDHGDLTGEYAAIPQEMKSVAKELGAEYLREIDEERFWQSIPRLREACGDRAVLRAIHFLGDNARVADQVAALRGGDFERFKELIVESGRSSCCVLQNVFASPKPQAQGLSLALAVSERLLASKGAWRVHGGGFAGTIQGFVPNELLPAYRSAMEGIFGEGSCYELSIRPAGGAKITPNLKEDTCHG